MGEFIIEFEEMNKDEMNKDEIQGALTACEYILNSLCLRELNGEGRQHISNYMAQLIRQKNEYN